MKHRRRGNDEIHINEQGVLLSGAKLATYAVLRSTFYSRAEMK